MSGKPDAGRWFVLGAEDADLCCPILEQRFFVHDLAQIRKIVSGDDDPTLDGVSYELDDSQREAFIQNFNVGRAFSGLEYVQLRDWHPLRDTPYLVHTCFELFLMLEGRKPFAHFADVYPGEWLDHHLAPFEPHVRSGRLIKRVTDEPFEVPQQLADGRVYEGSRRVGFALPGEEWRIDAYLLLWQVADMTGWNETLETLEGKLLGYEDWQVEWWLTSWRERRRQTAGSGKPIMVPVSRCPSCKRQRGAAWSRRRPPLRESASRERPDVRREVP